MNNDATPPDSGTRGDPADDTEVRAKRINRRAWYIFGLSFPLSLGAGFLGGLPYALARGLNIWGYSLGLTAAFGLIPMLIIGRLMRPTPRKLIRARISFGLSILVICVIVYTALFGM